MRSSEGRTWNRCPPTSSGFWRAICGGSSGCGIPPETSIPYRLKCPERLETKTSVSPASCGSTWRRAESSDSIRRPVSPPAVSTTERATGLGGYRHQHRLGDVEVRVDVLDVVGLLEPLDEPQHLARGRLVLDGDRRLGHH